MNYVYCRESSSQEKLLEQERTILAFCEENGISIVESICEIHNGNTLGAKFLNLLNKITADDNIIIYNFSRISRDIQALYNVIYNAKYNITEFSPMQNSVLFNKKYINISIFLTQCAELERDDFYKHEKSLIRVKIKRSKIR